MKYFFRISFSKSKKLSQFGNICKFPSLLGSFSALKRADERSIVEDSIQPSMMRTTITPIESFDDIAFTKLRHACRRTSQVCRKRCVARENVCDQNGGRSKGYKGERKLLATVVTLSRSNLCQLALSITSISARSPTSSIYITRTRREVVFLSHVSVFVARSATLFASVTEFMNNNQVFLSLVWIMQYVGNGFMVADERSSCNFVSVLIELFSQAVTKLCKLLYSYIAL